jgi:hypothetical protein
MTYSNLLKALNEAGIDFFLSDSHIVDGEGSYPIHSYVKNVLHEEVKGDELNYVKKLKLDHGSFTSFYLAMRYSIDLIKHLPEARKMREEAHKILGTKEQG